MEEGERSAAGPSASLDVVLEGVAPWRRFLLFGLCALVLMIEGFDMYMIGAIVPSLAGHFQVSPAAVTGVFVAQGLGLAVGYAIITPVADRLGRRPVILACVLTFALLTLAATQARALSDLVVLRFLAFMFFGGAMPNTIALLGECVPERRRQRAIVAINATHAFGGAMGSLIAPPLVQAYGWNAPFWAGGFAPLVLLLILFVSLPESPRFLVVRGAAPARIAKSLGMLGVAEAEAHAPLVSADPPPARVPVGELFRDGRLRATLLFMVLGALTMLVVNMISSWLPTFLHLLSGYSPIEAARFLAWSSVGAVLWPGIFMVVLVRLIGVKYAVVASYVLGAAFLSLFAASPLSPLAATALSIGFGAFVIGTIGGVNALAVAYYPTRMRASALGWTASLGRLFSVTGPAFGGFMVANAFSAPAVAAAFAVPLLLAACCTLFIPVSSKLN